MMIETIEMTFGVVGRVCPRMIFSGSGGDPNEMSNFWRGDRTAQCNYRENVALRVGYSVPAAE